MENNENLKIYNTLRVVPREAQKTIGAGRLKGMTDINPMWRIKALTEHFGPVGIGWYYEVTNRWIDEVDNERVANVEINLYVKYEGEWSKPIAGIGGSKLSTMESKGIYVSDEAYKMATTDAISVSCKQLGMGADVYWNKDNTKYNNNRNNNQELPTSEEDCSDRCSDKQVKFIESLISQKSLKREDFLSKYKDAKSFEDLSKAQAKALIDYLTRE